MRRFALLLLLLACAPRESTHRAATPATPTPLPLPAGIRWTPETATILCSTGTKLAVPERLAAKLERAGENELRIVEPGGALLVRTSRGGDGTNDFFEDWLTLHQLLGPIAESVTIETNLSFHRDHFVVRYVVPEGPETQTYTLAYGRFTRDGATCRIAAIERGDARPATIVDTLDGIVDTRRMLATTSRSKPRDPLWTLVNGILGAGARVVLDSRR